MTMVKRIWQPKGKPRREGLSWHERWDAEDLGVIAAWEVGRELRDRGSPLAALAERDELPVLPWKGGVAQRIKKKRKYGTLKYLAEWQGLRGDDLDIDLDDEVELTCSKTGMTVIYTPDREKYREA
jgi:hypothetical protein